MGFVQRFRSFLVKIYQQTEKTVTATARRRRSRPENFTSIKCRVHLKGSKVKRSFKKSQIHQKINLYKFYLFDKKVLRPTYSMLFSFLCRISPPRKAVSSKSPSLISPAGRPISKQLRLKCFENCRKVQIKNSDIKTTSTRSLR